MTSEFVSTTEADAMMRDSIRNLTEAKPKTNRPDSDLPTLLDITNAMEEALSYMEALELAVTSPAITLQQRNPLSVLAGEVKGRFEIIRDNLDRLAAAERASS
jgi:hypothetical protein